MSSIDEVEILKDRAYAFLRNAERLFVDGEYDLAAFNIEQFCQLLLKYKLLVKTSTYPRTHSILRLIRELDKIVPEKGLAEFVDAEIMNLTKIEDAYIVSRYLPRRYERREVEEMLRFAKRFEEAFRDV
ncbi:MAG: HEPN domain-containing protein [Nitrososphaeria archaeon]|nr:HEPN domain-containing protein [Aigarchaeota archaeon]MCX8188056.1 HEPN domain-containing protein [Nitrososphaeria archaeon]